MNTLKKIQNMTYCTGAHPEIRAHFRQGQRPTEFGNKVWPTSLVAINFLAENPQLLTGYPNGCRVLEIGCGWGLIGVYLACDPSFSVTCSDLDPNVLPIVQLNAKLNHVVVQTVQSCFDGLSEDFLCQFDLIIGAEVCYSEGISIELTALIQRAFAATVSQIILVDPGRPDFDVCHQFCSQHFDTECFILPGSPNGKQTQLLCVKNCRN